MTTFQLVAAVFGTAFAIVWLSLDSQTYDNTYPNEDDEEPEDRTKAKHKRRYSDHLHQTYIDTIKDTEVNPFTNETRLLTSVQRLKISFMTITVSFGMLC
jgi:hypothetical protein